jgi:AraC-like DNA-binding protein
MPKNIEIGPDAAVAKLGVFDAKRFHSEAEREIPPHAHDRGQFTCVLSGVISQQTDAQLWVVPRRRLIWIPPGTVHAAKSRGPVDGWLVLAPAGYARHLPNHVSVLRSSDLLLATLERLTRLPADDRATAALLDQVILLELDQTEAEALEIPLPQSSGLRDVAEKLLAEPADDRGLDYWARASGLSRRSFTRHFACETGLSFSHWRRRVIARCAIERLSEGEPVSSVALSMGYESVSAFIAMFKRLHGAPPAKFLAGHD